MRRAAFLFCAEVDAPRFKVLDQRGHLPFVPSGGRGDGRWGEYTLNEAFQLRLMLDLIGGEGPQERDEDQLKGLSPSYAAKVVFNSLSRLRSHPLQQAEQQDLWLGVVIFEEPKEEEQGTRLSEWYAGELENLSAWITERREKENFNVVRVFLANATRAAGRVRDRASQLGLLEADDFTEIVR